jgi:hypothetical protein
MTNISAPTPTPARKPFKPFPAWRLPKGIIKASDSELEKSIESCERWEWFGGGLVVVGVIAEVVIAVMHPPYDSFMEQWGSSVANSLVAIGVALEIKLGQMAGLRQNELKRRSDEKVGEANIRAAEAELRTEQLRSELAWRRISTRQAEKISEILGRADLPKFGLRIFHVALDPEALTLSQDIAEVFRRNGWPVLFMATTEAIPPGMMIPLYEAPDFDACAITRGAFENAGIEVMGGYPEESGGMSVASGDEITGPSAAIYVGSRVPPKLNPPAAAETAAADP